LSKARIVVDGVIQGVGYRALVKQAARQLGLKGLVRNLEGTGVEIFCDGPVEKIREFLKKIERKTDVEDFLSVNVSKIECFFEGEPEYQPAWKEFKGFEVDYGVGELTPLEESMFDDHEFSKLYFIGFRDELKGFSERTDGNFREMAEKYGDISVELKEFRKSVDTFLKAFLSEYRGEETIFNQYKSENMKTLAWNQRLGCLRENQTSLSDTENRLDVLST
jgi:acylphosphatase